MVLRTATEADLGRIARTAARAFADDPFWRWAVPEDGYAHRCELLAQSAALIYLHLGTTWITDDVAAVAVWSPPEVTPPPPEAMSRALDAAVEATGERLKRLIAFDELSSRSWPDEPHWCLQVLAVHPDWQRQGLADQLLREVLAVCDGEGLPSALGTENRANLAFYRRFGFEIFDEADLPDDGPHRWVLRREPRLAT